MEESVDVVGWDWLSECNGNLTDLLSKFEVVILFQVSSRLENVLGQSGKAMDGVVSHALYQVDGVDELIEELLEALEVSSA